MKHISKAQKTAILGFVLFVSMVLVSVFSEKGFVTAYDFRNELETLEITNEKLSADNTLLKDEVTALKSDSFAVEKVARGKLNLVKPGEVVYQIIPKKQLP